MLTMLLTRPKLRVMTTGQDASPAVRHRDETLAGLFDVGSKVVLVTGGGSGLGLAIAGVLADCGARVVIADRDEQRLKDAGADLSARGHAEQALVDVSDPRAVTELADGIVARHGRLDVAFANAGIGGGRPPGHPAGSIDSLDLDQWHALLGVNLHGVVHTVRAAAAHMKKQRSGSIIVTASTAGLRQDPFVSYSYTVAKAGVVNLVRQAALDLARWQVRVNAIAPGPFRTNIGGGGPMPPEAVARWNAAVPLGRIGDPAEIRGLALLLASDASSFMTGGVYLADGGQMLMSPPVTQS
jgi:NAD(P)-dependent dehydrogenase (short-subunit alcohol dehydrogenase family)